MRLEDQMMILTSQEYVDLKFYNLLKFIK